jgi:multicomponent K+:H+ antiporter subunit E/multicomponent Na+:H+ antiporter subunit E
MRRRAIILARLLLRFASHSVLSGIATARVIQRRRPPLAGLVRMRFAPMSETGAAVLGAMVTLTPGSSVIDIDPARREMLLHLLDRSAADATVASIRRDFEGDVCTLFPVEAQR